ncbi:hypothetical protein CYMTET_4424 [Cymbomonas tetramitiformis]|uniref:non-specific serine/threonine protein kinase n=1 Tax=Cymbomonas tetramitiformis TaxID=36881 RepID=A0AAE0H1H0_9CHLO|nr:hypothetical protein CYMTET_4424 [Cymbomonas tetramitiformis]
MASELSALLQQPVSKQSGSEKKEEARKLEDFAIQFAKCYDFSAASLPNLDMGTFLRLLFAKRVNCDDWPKRTPPDHKLRVLQCIRLVLRDNSFMGLFIELGGIEAVSSIFTDLSSDHFLETQPPFNSGLLVECASIIKKLATDGKLVQKLMEYKVHETLVYLLRTGELSLLPLLLVALMSLAERPECSNAIGELDCVDVLLRVLEEYAIQLKGLAADVLATLCRQPANCLELLHLGGIPKLLSMLHTEDQGLLEALLRLLCHITVDVALVQEFRYSGGIPVICSLLGAGQSGVKHGEGVVCALCLAITKLAMDDETAYQIRQQNGVYLLGLLLVDSCTSDKVKAYVFRALRYLFSMERNRKIFKRIFPPELYGPFIDAGHYETDLELYKDLTRRMNALNPEVLESIRACLADINQLQDLSRLKWVRGYAMEEELGRGAFGCVYQVRKEKGETLFAMKELSLNDVGIFGATIEERNEEVLKLNSEVRILSELDHPNIVRHYESFAEGNYLYIVMDLADGVSLLDFINSHSEKGQIMPERQGSLPPHLSRCVLITAMYSFRHASSYFPFTRTVHYKILVVPNNVVYIDLMCG